LPPPSQMSSFPLICPVVEVLRLIAALDEISPAFDISFPLFSFLFFIDGLDDSFFSYAGLLIPSMPVGRCVPSLWFFWPRFSLSPLLFPDLVFLSAPTFFPLLNLVNSVTVLFLMWKLLRFSPNPFSFGAHLLISDNAIFC